MINNIISIKYFKILKLKKGNGVREQTQKNTRYNMVMDGMDHTFLFRLIKFKIYRSYIEYIEPIQLVIIR